MIVGIDPGLTGAIAFLDGESYFVEDMPVMARGKGAGKVKNQVNPSELYTLLAMRGVKLACVERVSSMPGQGVAGVFSLGDTFGCIRGVIAAIGIPLELVTPQKWKKYYNIGSDKEIVRARAIERFPKAELSRKKDHNRSEALLIARYAQMNLVDK